MPAENVPVFVVLQNGAQFLAYLATHFDTDSRSWYLYPERSGGYHRIAGRVTHWCPYTPTAMGPSEVKHHAA
jgi:hypothetical protein